MALDQESTQPALPAGDGFGPLYRPEPVDVEPVLETIRGMEAFRPKGEGLLDRLMEHPFVKEALEGFSRMMTDMLDNIREFMLRFTPSEMSALPDHVITTVSYVVGALLAFMVVVLLYAFLSWLRRRIRRKEPQALPAQGRYHQGMTLQDAEFHKKSAGILAGRGDHAGAIRQLYLAMLCYLDEKKLVPFEDARTNLEYLDELETYSTAELTRLFSEISLLFESIRYGGHEASETGFTHGSEVLEQLVGLIVRVARRGSREGTAYDG